MTGLMDCQSRMDRRTPVLLVEGSRSDIPAVSNALDALGISYGCISVSTAAEALTYLRENAVPKPTIILFDGAAPEAVGLEVLRRLKADDRLKSIPVIVLASSGDAWVINESFDLGAAGYIVRPSDSQERVESLRAIDRYWTLSQVPQAG